LTADAGDAAELGQRIFSAEWEKSLASILLRVSLVKYSGSDETENEEGSRVHYPSHFCRAEFPTKTS